MRRPPQLPAVSWNTWSVFPWLRLHQLLPASEPLRSLFPCLKFFSLHLCTPHSLGYSRCLLMGPLHCAAHTAPHSLPVFLLALFSLQCLFAKADVVLNSYGSAFSPECELHKTEQGYVLVMLCLAPRTVSEALGHTQKDQWNEQSAEASAAISDLGCGLGRLVRSSFIVFGWCWCCAGH